MSKRAEDVRRWVAGRAFKDAEGEVAARVSGERHGVARRTAQSYREHGHPAFREFLAYMAETPDPWRLSCEVNAAAKRQTISKLSDADVVRRYRDLLLVEAQVECDDRAADHDETKSWLDRAQASARDCAINAEKCAIEQEIAARNIPLAHWCLG